jgi:hypothetical protein
VAVVASHRDDYMQDQSSASSHFHRRRMLRPRPSDELQLAAHLAIVVRHSYPSAVAGLLRSELFIFLTFCLDADDPPCCVAIVLMALLFARLTLSRLFVSHTRQRFRRPPRPLVLNESAGRSSPHDGFLVKGLLPQIMRAIVDQSRAVRQAIR